MGRFAIRARVGAGGMGEVYRAEDTQLKRAVALKRIRPQVRADENYRQRFLREARCASGLANQHVAAIYDVLESDGEFFLVMEYVEGVTLRQRLSRPLSIEQFLEIVLQCAAALVAAHERSIVHRDIKPENIMLTPAGQVKILDFGVAKQLTHADGEVTLESLASGSGSLSGTPAYMAPEVLLEKEPDQRADIFSLGVVFYEALSGRHPFLAGSFMATSDRILHEVPAPLTRLNPKVPAELERIVAKMLAKDQAERYATAADLLVDLRAVQRVGPYPAPLPPRALSAPRRGKWWALAAAVGVLLVVGIGLLPKMHRPDRWFGPRVVAGPKVLAVLPFQAIGGAPENQAYSDGITGTLTAQLTWLTPAHALQVVPPSEVHARHVSSAGEARKELGVNLVLEGTLDRSGNAVRVNYALVDAVTLRQLRAETITAEASDPFAVQDRVAEGLVKMLELELNPQERQALQTHGTQVAGAYDFYLQGHGYLQNYDRPENIENAISVFQRALSLDPNYSLAHAGLGEAYWRKYEVRKEFHWIEPARKACGRALALDEKLAAAHICLGTLDNGTGQYGSATAEFHRALETEPTSDDAYRGLGFAYEHLGKLAEAERTHRQAIDLRPQYWGGYSWLGAFYFRQARYSDAAEMFKHVVALVPDSFRAYNNLGGTYIHMGRYNDAVAVLQRSVAIRPNAIGYSNLATAYFHQRQFAEAARTFEEAVKLDQRDYQLWGNLGDAYFWAPGKRADAVRAYQKAITLARENLPINPRDAHLLGDLANYHALLQERSAATAYLGQALKIAPNDGDLRFKAALVYNELGETGKALEWLGKALAAGYSPSKVHDTPNFDHLRSNPRFQELFRGK